MSYRNRLKVNHHYEDPYWTIESFWWNHNEQYERKGKCNRKLEWAKNEEIRVKKIPIPRCNLWNSFCGEHQLLHRGSWWSRSHRKPSCPALLSWTWLSSCQDGNAEKQIRNGWICREILCCHSEVKYFSWFSFSKTQFSPLVGKIDSEYFVIWVVYICSMPFNITL